MIRIKAARKCVGDFVLSRWRVRFVRVFDVAMTLTVMGVAVEVIVMMAPSHIKKHRKAGYGKLSLFMFVKNGAGESEALVVVRLKCREAGENSRTS